MFRHMSKSAIVGIYIALFIGSFIFVPSFIPSSATAHHRIDYGADYIEEVNGHWEYACDHEFDSYTLYSYNYRSNGYWAYTYDGNASQPGCGQAYDSSFVVTWHQPCRDINNWPDACGNSGYTGH